MQNLSNKRKTKSMIGLSSIDLRTNLPVERSGSAKGRTIGITTTVGGQQSTSFHPLLASPRLPGPQPASLTPSPPASLVDDQTEAVGAEDPPEILSPLPHPPIAPSGGTSRKGGDSDLRRRIADFLPVLYEYHAPQNPSGACQTCHKRSGSISCCDCFENSWVCEICILAIHRHAPFHRIRRWKESCLSVNVPPPWSYHWSSLDDMGLSLYLGHEGKLCLSSRPQTARHIFVLHTNGLHKLKVHWCDCGETKGMQLLRHRLYPATEEKPRLAYTFELLETFLQVQLETHCSAQSYYDATLKLTPLELWKDDRPDCYEHFNKCSREWRLLGELQRFQKESAGILQSGELAVRCGMCPIPGVNLPSPLPSDHKSNSLLYRRYDSLDGNFSLYLNSRPGQSTDPSYFGDSAFWVNSELASAYVQKLGADGDNEDVATCQNRRAGDPTRSARGAKKLITGIVSASCSRHSVFRPSGTIDLTHGERFPFVDCVVAPAILDAAGLPSHMLTYDVMCKYVVNLAARLRRGGFLDAAEALETRAMKYAIPKYHLAGHSDDCMDKFSLNYIEGAARVHGEGVEAQWSDFGKFKYLTRDMKPGGRIDLLTVAMNHWNSGKLLRAVPMLLAALNRAYIQVSIETKALGDLEASIPSKLLSAWLNEFNKCADGSIYRRKHLKPLARASVIQRLQNEEEKSMQNLPVNIRAAAVSPSSFMSLALDLEGQIIKLKEGAKGAMSKASSAAGTSEDNIPAFLLSKKKLSNRLAEHFSDLAKVVPALQNHPEPDIDSQMKKIELLMPSDYPEPQRAAIGLDKLARVEAALRIPFAQDAVSHLRDAIGSKAYLLSRQKGVNQYNTGGTIRSTRLQGQIVKLNGKISVFKAEYRRHLSALSNLGSTPVELLGCDLRQITDDDLEKATTWLQTDLKARLDSDDPPDRRPLVSQRPSIPWLWSGLGVSSLSFDAGNDEVANLLHSYAVDAVRVEWLHAKAAKARWEEELDLLIEELRRIGVYFKYEETKLVKSIQSGGSGRSNGYQAFLEEKRRMWNELADEATKAYNDVRKNDRQVLPLTECLVKLPGK